MHSIVVIKYFIEGHFNKGHSTAIKNFHVDRNNRQNCLSCHIFNSFSWSSFPSKEEEKGDENEEEEEEEVWTRPMRF